MTKQKPSMKQIMKAVESGDLIGFCSACGAERDCCEPDAREYPCDDCGESTVYGAEELLLMRAV